MDDNKLIAGRYERGVVIGAGGMGSVYKGIDTVTGEIIAIKELKPELVKSDPEMLARFIREGEALRKLNHPNIVKMLGSGQDAEQNHYLMMEFIDGGSLREQLDAHPLMNIEQALNIALDLSDALVRAHRVNIIHRDIKPANVLIASDGTPRLSDFGVARMTDTAQMTRTGMVVGTLAYLPPEALNGDKIDHRADIWAFGVMLYEMVAGRHPFASDNTGSLLASVLYAPTPDLFSLRPELPLALAGLIYWMLEKDRDSRPDSMRQIGAIIENLLTGKEFRLEIPPVDGQDALAMPTPEQLAEAMRRYSTGSARVDDLKAIAETQSLQQTDLIQSNPTPPRQSKFTISIFAIIVIAVLAGVGLLLSGAFAGAPADEPMIVAIEPIEDWQIMVLVAQPERIQGDERDVQRFIVEDLRTHLEEGAPFSRFRIRTYPAVITSEEEALRIAQQHHAHVIIWGNYDNDRVEIAMQLGDMGLFPSLVVPESEARELADVRYRMTSERQQTLAFGVIASMNVIMPLNQDNYVVSENLAISALITESPADVIGSSVSAFVHRAISIYVQDTSLSLDYINQAIAQDSNNAMLYLTRSLSHLRLDNIVATEQDIATASRLGAENWAGPLFMKAMLVTYVDFDLAIAVTYLEQALQFAPDDWFLNSYAASMHYLLGNYEQSEYYTEIALSLNPRANFVYSPAIGLAMRNGDLARTQILLDEVLEKFPDPRFVERILRVVLNPEAAEVPFVPYLAAFGNFTLQRWQSVIDDTQSVIDKGYESGDIYFLQGLAYCNLNDLVAAETAYTRGLEVDSTTYMLYFMRADVRRQQNNLLGALADLRAIGESPLAEQVAPILRATTTGDVAINCRTFMDIDLSALGIETTAEATENP